MHGRGTYTYAEGDRHAYPPSHPAEACKPHLYPTTYPATTAACGRLGRVHLACISRASRVPLASRSRRYEGDWKDDRRHGKGTVTYAAPDGGVAEKFEGDWSDGRMHGYGKVCHVCVYVCVYVCVCMAAAGATGGRAQDKGR